MTRKNSCLLLFFLAILLLGIIFSPQINASARAMGFVFQIIPSSPIRPLEWLTPQPIYEEVSFYQSGDKGIADIYRPNDDDVHAGVILFLGVNPAGNNDPRVVRLAEGLARTGLVVMIPWSDSMKEFVIDPGEIDNLVYAFQYLSSLSYVDPERLGMGGFCVGASISVVAAQDERIKEAVKFVNFFGGYYDARDLLISVASNTRFYGAGEKHWMHSDMSHQVLINHLLDNVQDFEERMLLEQHFLMTDRQVPLHMSELSENGNIVYKLLDEPSLSEARDLLDRLPQQFRDDLLTVSPSNHIGDLQSQMFIMHDFNDSNVPSEESRRLYNSLDKENGVHYSEFLLFDHMDPDRSLGFVVWSKEVWKLYVHLYQIMKISY